MPWCVKPPCCFMLSPLLICTMTAHGTALLYCQCWCHLLMMSDMATLLAAALQWYQCWNLTSCFFIFFLLSFAAAPVITYWTACNATNAAAIPTITASFDHCSSQLSLAVAAVTTCCSAPCCYQCLCCTCSPAPMLWYLHWYLLLFTFLMQLLSLHSDCTVVCITLMPPPLLICLWSIRYCVSSCFLVQTMSLLAAQHGSLADATLSSLLLPVDFATFDILPCVVATVVCWCHLHCSSYCCHDRVDHSCCHCQQQLRQWPHTSLYFNMIDEGCKGCFRWICNNCRTCF